MSKLILQGFSQIQWVLQKLPQFCFFFFNSLGLSLINLERSRSKFLSHFNVIWKNWRRSIPFSFSCSKWKDVKNTITITYFVLLHSILLHLNVLPYYAPTYTEYGKVFRRCLEISILILTECKRIKLTSIHPEIIRKPKVFLRMISVRIEFLISFILKMTYFKITP